MPSEKENAFIKAASNNKGGTTKNIKNNHITGYATKTENLLIVLVVNQKHIDFISQPCHYKGVSCNRLTSFSRLKRPGRRTASYPVLCGIFTSAPFVIPFSMVGGGSGGFVPAGTGCQSANLNLLPATSMFSSMRVVLIDQPEKGFTMNNKHLLIVPIRTFSTLIEANQYIDFLIQTNENIRLNLFQSTQGWELGRVAA